MKKFCLICFSMMCATIVFAHPSSGICLATDIVNLVGVSLSILPPRIVVNSPTYVAPAPTVISTPSIVTPTVVNEVYTPPVVTQPVYVQPTPTVVYSQPVPTYYYPGYRPYYYYGRPYYYRPYYRPYYRSYYYRRW